MLDFNYNSLYRYMLDFNYNALHRYILLITINTNIVDRVVEDYYYIKFLYI